MRNFSTALVAASTAIALASPAAIAQVPRQSAATATTTSTTNQTPIGANTTVLPPTVGAAPATATQEAGKANAANSGAAATTATTTNQGADPANIPNSMRTGTALRQSEGQTSSGTVAGNSSPGVTGPTFGSTATTRTTNTSGTDGNTGTNGNTGAFTRLPVAGAVIGGVGMGTETSASVNANGERTGSGTSSPTLIAGQSTVTPTPLFDMMARQGMAKQQQRRAQGREPTIIGLAPRTNVDRTWQMPDDPIIRY